MGLELLARPRPLTPFDEAPTGTTLIGHVALGARPDGSIALDWRLPSGVPFDDNNPAHVFGLFVVQNAQQLLSLAMETRNRVRVQQTNEIIAANSLQGA